MELSQKVVIIGAGIGGLASGHFLNESGREVEIYERSCVPGGRIQLLEREGSRVDVGAQYFHTNYVETLKLLDALGLKDKLLPIRPPVKLIRNGRGFLVKHNTLRYRMIPLGSNLKFARLIWTTLRNFGRIDVYYNDPLEEFEDIELAEYILQKCDKGVLEFQLAEHILQKCDEDVLEFLVRPIITAFNLSDPEGESLAHFLRITKQFLTSSDTCLPTGMYTMPDHLARKLPVTYNAETQQIQTESGRVTGVRVLIGGEMRRIEAANVICATPLKELARLLPILTDEEKGVIRDFKYSQFPMAVFFMKRRLPENHWAYVFSRTENFKAAFTSDAAFKCEQMVPSGKSVLQAWFVGEAGDQLVDETDEKIVELAKGEMRRVIPEFDEEVESVEVMRHHTGMPRYEVGMYRRLRDFLKSVSRIEGLHLVGDYYGHSTIETVVRSARKVADHLAAGA
jgi:protoporphyrinogen oxidase